MVITDDFNWKFYVHQDVDANTPNSDAAPTILRSPMEPTRKAAGANTPNMAAVLIGRSMLLSDQQEKHQISYGNLNGVIVLGHIIIIN